MIIKVVPIIQTQIDWDTYLRLTTDSIGRSPTVVLDERWHKITNSLSDFIATLKEINSPGSPPFTLAGRLLEHVFAGFIVVASKTATMKIVSNCNLKATTVDSKSSDFNYTVITGTLAEWRTALLDYCSDEAHVDLRTFGSMIYNHFEQADVKQLLSGITKIPIHDGTMRLLSK